MLFVCNSLPTLDSHSHFLIGSPIIEYYSFSPFSFAPHILGSVGAGTNSCIILFFYSAYYSFQVESLLYTQCIKYQIILLFLIFLLMCECPRFFFAIQNDDFGCVPALQTFLLVFFSLFVSFRFVFASQPAKQLYGYKCLNLSAHRFFNSSYTHFSLFSECLKRLLAH